MKAETITIHVTPQAAVVYRSASDEERRKMDLLVSLQLTGLSKSSESLETAIDAMSREAVEAGLTPKILDSFLVDA